MTQYVTARAIPACACLRAHRAARMGGWTPGIQPGATSLNKQSFQGNNMAATGCALACSSGKNIGICHYFFLLAHSSPHSGRKRHSISPFRLPSIYAPILVLRKFHRQLLNLLQHCPIHPSSLTPHYLLEFFSTSANI